MNYTVLEQYWIWLSSIEGIGPKRFYQLLSLFEDARNLWDCLSNPNNLSALRFLGRPALEHLKAARDEGYFYRLFDSLDRLNVRAITRASEGYPASLTSIFDPPPTLYVRGDCPLESERMFAIVGSRRCTRDGQRAAREIAEKSLDFSPAARRELSVLSTAVSDMVSLSFECFKKNNVEDAFRVEPFEERIDILCDEMKLHHVDRLQKGLCTLGQGFVFNDLLTNYERVADHCSNIAVALIELESDSFDTHEYLNSLKELKSDMYERYYEEYRRVYQL